ncbi:MAG: rhomboid family intramembrane serine protease [archaeon]
MPQLLQFHPQKRKRRSFFSGLSVNTTLILVNLVFFILMLILGFFPPIEGDCSDTICEYIALKPLNIFQGQYIWTFITSMFMHGGLGHIFVNMLSLFFVGSLVERILGPKRYLWFYLISGLFAGLFFVLMSLIWQADINSFAVGASGALFGLIGLLVLLTPNLPVYVMFVPIPIKMKYAGPGILLVLWLISSLANIRIGNTAHLGGLIAGLVYGIYLKNKYKNKTKYISRMFS